MKKVQNFSTGVLSHVKSYYNNNLWASSPAAADGGKKEGLEPSAPAEAVVVDPVTGAPPLNGESTFKIKRRLNSFCVCE